MAILPGRGSKSLNFERALLIASLIGNIEEKVIMRKHDAGPYTQHENDCALCRGNKGELGLVVGFVAQASIFQTPHNPTVPLADILA